MHSLRRLTQSVAVRHPTVLAAIRPIVVSNPTASPPSSMPHMSPLSHYAFSPVAELPLHGRPFASLSGKEHSDSMEPEKGAQKFKRSAADAQKASNQGAGDGPNAEAAHGRSTSTIFLCRSRRLALCLCLFVVCSR